MQSPLLQLLQDGRQHRGKMAFRRCILAIVVLAAIGSGHAQMAENLRSIHTLAVASLGDGAEARAVRHRIVQRLEKSGRIKFVEDPGAADAELRGASSIWATGTVVIDPRSNSSRQTNYLGYISMEIVGKGNQPLWSYLVTPSRFRSGSITDDLADHAATRLLSAIESDESGSTAPLAGARPHVTLHAAGATLPAPLYLQWFESSGIRVAYDPIGSEAGIQQLKDGKVDFAASDMPLTSQDSSGPSPVIQIPIVVGGVVPIYNLPGLGRELDLTPEVLAGIYSGKIRKWNDPALRKSNPGAPLPNAEIAVVHRSEGSGTTFVWTSFLSSASPEWKTSVGSGTHVAWPAGTDAEGNQGVADLVKKTPNSIGYAELIYAIQHQLDYAAVRNPAGRFIRADLASITAAAAEAAPSADREFPISILNARNKAAYPVSTFTWILVPKDVLDPGKKAAIADLLKWMLTTGQKQCAALGYPPLPQQVAARALDAVDRLK
jgi:phosphate ABC transporter phosphate-binding protein